MRYSFTDRVRQVLAQARQESFRFRHGYVGPEHILLALVREAEGVAASVLHYRGVLSEAVTREVEVMLQAGTSARAAGLGELPYTSRGKKVLEFAMAEARELGHTYVGTEHLLLGLLREGSEAAGAVLTRLGLSLDDARDEVRRLLSPAVEGEDPGTGTGTRPAGNRLVELVRGAFGGRTPPPPTGAPEPAPAFTVRIDEFSSQSIYEQIVARVQEAVATGRLRPGDRLPAVRQMADQLDIAPGTVARAYGELERLGVVVTEGARGTRVAQRAQSAIPDASRPETLVGLLRPVAVAAFHLGATARELRDALEEAMHGIFGDDGAQPLPGPAPGE